MIDILYHSSSCLYSGSVISHLNTYTIRNKIPKDAVLTRSMSEYWGSDILLDALDGILEGEHSQNLGETKERDEDLWLEFSSITKA